MKKACKSLSVKKKPPSSNRGVPVFRKVEKMEVTRRIDWFQFTHHHSDEWKRYMPYKLNQGLGEEIKPLPRYDFAHKIWEHGRVDISRDTHQGVQITLGGQAMTELNANSISFQNIIKYGVEYGKVVRLDYATDIHQSRYAADEPFWREVELYVANNQYQSRLKANNEISNKKDAGYTQYFGSYKSDRFIRVYDKGAESGLLIEAMKQHKVIDHWTRVELVNKRDFAHNIASDMAYGGWQWVGAATLQKLLWFKLSQVWREVTKGLSVQLTEVGRKPPKWQKWLDTQVLPSILEHAKNPKDKEFILRWIQVLVGNVWDDLH